MVTVSGPLGTCGPICALSQPCLILQGTQADSMPAVTPYGQQQQQPDRSEPQQAPSEIPQAQSYQVRIMS